ncbi:MAG TPA: hypothetical protein VLF43_04635 [Candidatus Saccharimonadales bacterium]|nr:hypothetical protein [Candidatus Saccharimonadales bacterium]
MFNVSPETRTKFRTEMDYIRRGAAMVAFIAAMGVVTDHANEICVFAKAAAAYDIAALTGNGLPGWTPEKYRPTPYPGMLSGPEINNVTYNNISNIAGATVVRSECF